MELMNTEGQRVRYKCKNYIQSVAKHECQRWENPAASIISFWYLLPNYIFESLVKPSHHTAFVSVGIISEFEEIYCSK